MAGLGSSLLGDVGRSSAAVARPKPKKRKPAPKVMRAPVKKHAPARKQEVRLGQALLGDISRVTRDVASGKKRKPSRMVGAKGSVQAGAGLTGASGHELEQYVDALVDHATRFGSRKTEARDAIGQATYALRHKLGIEDANADMRLPTRKASGGSLPVAAGLLGLKGAQLLAAAPGALASQLAKVPELAAALQDANGDPLVKQLHGGKDIARNLTRDAVAIMEAPAVFPLQLTGALASDVTHGRTSATTKLAGELAHALGQSPIVQLGGAGLGVKGASVKGALESLEAHPGFAVADLGLVEGAVGRVAGASMRALGKRESPSAFRRKVAEVSDLRRPAIGLTKEASLARGGYVHDQGHYSKDPAKAYLQKRSDRKRGTIKDKNNETVKIDVRGKELPVLAPRGGGKTGREGMSVRQKARHPVQAMRAHEELGTHEARKLQEKRADFVHSQAVSANAIQRARADRDFKEGVKSSGVKGKAGREVASLVTTGLVKTAATMKDDLIKRADEIRDVLAKDRETRAAGGESVYRDRQQRARAKDNEALLRKYANDPKVIGQAERIFAAGTAHAKSLNAVEREEIRLGVHSSARAERARLSEFALAHVPGVRHVTVKEHEHLEAQARVRENEAKAAWETATPGPARVEAARVYEAAREKRIAVSGRDPARVRDHERATEVHGKAAERHKKASEAVVRAERSRNDLLASQRAQRIAGGTPRKATAAEKARLEKRTQHLNAMREREQSALGHVRHAEDLLRKNPRPDVNPALRHADGRHLSNQEIAETARGHGRDPDSIAFLPHVEDTLGGRAFYKQFRPGTRPKAGPETRKGHLFQRGSNSFGSERVLEQLSHKRTTVSKVSLLDKLINDGAVVHPDFPALKARHDRNEALRAAGETVTDRLTPYERRVVKGDGNFTTREAGEMLAQLEREGHEFVAVTRRPASLERGLRDRIDDLHDPVAMETAMSDLIQNRLVKKFDNSEARTTVLYPAHEFQRLIDHLAPAGHVERMAQMLNAPFRMAVLPQPRWLTGNFVEPYLIRLPLSGAGINLAGAAMDSRFAKKWMRELEKDGSPAALRELDAMEAQLGGLFVGRRTASQRRTFEDLKPGTKGRKVAYGAHWVRNAPVTRQLGDIALMLPKAFFAANRLAVERGAQKQAIGRSLRHDVEAFTGSWGKSVRLTSEVMREMRGKDGISTPTLERWAREQHELLGKYEGFSPGTRRLIQTATPFLPWWMASMRFMFYTMPAKHPIANALLLRASTVNAEMWKDMHKDAPPGMLRDALRTANGGFVDIARYGPAAGTIPLVHGDYSDIVDQFFPSLTGVIAAARGKDPFGKPLKTPEGDVTALQKLAIAANSTMESFTPLAALGRRLLEGGGTAYSNSYLWDPKTKPGTSYMPAVRRALDPFRPTYLKPPTDQASSPAAASGGSRWGRGADAPAETVRPGSRWGR